VKEGEIILALLLPPNKEPTGAIEPGMGMFDDPATLPHRQFSVSVCLPLRTPFVFRSYDILIKRVQQVVYPSSGGGARPRLHADDTLKAVSVPLRQPTPPSGVGVHRVGALAPPLDESSARASPVGCEGGEPVRLATIHRVGTPHDAELAGAALSCLTGVAAA